MNFTRKRLPKGYCYLKDSRDMMFPKCSITCAGMVTTYIIECPNTIKLKSRSEYRMRVGSWRIFFDVDQFVRIIKIQEVKKRNERTY
jgi:hypothetical protein